MKFMCCIVLSFLFLKIVSSDAGLDDHDHYINPVNDYEQDHSAKDQDKRTVFAPHHGWAKHIGIHPAGFKYVIGYGPVDLKYVPVVKPVSIRLHPYHHHHLKLHVKPRPVVFKPVRPVVHHDGWKPAVPVVKPVVPLVKPVLVPPQIPHRPWHDGWHRPVHAHPVPVVPVKPVVQPVKPVVPVVQFVPSRPLLPVAPVVPVAPALKPIQPVVIQQVPLHHHHHLVQQVPIAQAPVLVPQHIHPHHDVPHHHHAVPVHHHDLPVHHHDVPIPHQHLFVQQQLPGHVHVQQLPEQHPHVHLAQEPPVVHHHHPTIYQQQYPHVHLPQDPRLIHHHPTIYHQQLPEPQPDVFHQQLPDPQVPVPDPHVYQQLPQDPQDQLPQNPSVLYHQHLPGNIQHHFNQHIQHGEGATSSVLLQGAVIQPGQTDLQIPEHLPQHPNYLPGEGHFPRHFHDPSQDPNIVRPNVGLEPPFTHK